MKLSSKVGYSRCNAKCVFYGLYSNVPVREHIKNKTQFCDQNVIIHIIQIVRKRRDSVHRRRKLHDVSNGIASLMIRLPHSIVDYSKSRSVIRSPGQAVGGDGE
jgi:hypothetical protein